MYSIVLKIFCPEIFLSFCILYQLLFNTRIINKISLNYPLINLEVFIQSFFILLCLLLLVCNQRFDLLVPNFFFFFDFSTRLLKIILVFFSIFIGFLFWKSFILQNINFFEFFIFYFFSLLSSLLLLNCSDLISFYLVIEIQALSFYILASIKRNSSFSTEAGLKYFIIGSLSSAFFLLGSFFIYLCLGTLNFKNIEILLSFSIRDDFVVNFIFLGVFFIVVTFFLKVAAAPFHFWAPDVYEGAPIGSTLVFSILPKISIFVIFIRWISLFFNFFFTLKFLFLLIGLFSVVFGAYFAFVQKRLKRFIIYSSISQVGFLIIILSVNDFNSINSLFFYLFIYLLTSILLWGNLISYNYFSQAYTKYKNKNNNPIFISDLSFYFKINYIWSITFSFIFFSFAGIPPFSGFLAKVLVLFSIISDYNFLVVFFLVLITLISSYYYLKIIKILFFDSDLKLDKKLFYITQENYNFNLDCLLYSSISFLLIFFFFFPTILTVVVFLITIFLL